MYQLIVFLPLLGAIAAGLLATALPKAVAQALARPGGRA